MSGVITSYATGQEHDGFSGGNQHIADIGSLLGYEKQGKEKNSNTTRLTGKDGIQNSNLKLAKKSLLGG
jgi:hypothetical protein